MNVWRFIFSLCVFSVFPAFGESLLTAQSFPKTADDMTFVEKMELKTDDYGIYMPVYDERGVCIQYCAYPGLTIEEEYEKVVENTRQALLNAVNYFNNSNLSIDAQNIVSAVSETSSLCFGRNEDIPVGQKSPYGEPLKGRPPITSPYTASRTLEGKTKPHYAIDYGVPKNTTVYSPADGIVSAIINDSSCGKGMRIKHYDGTQTIYCHLNKVLLEQGAFVGAGCPIAKSGNTGHVVGVTGEHLHYAIRGANNEPVLMPAFTGRGS